MVCKECNKSIAKNSNYCKYCGTKVEKAVAVQTEKKAADDASLIFREIDVTEEEADNGAERVLEFDGAAEPLHIIFPKLFCTGQLFMVKKFKFLNEEGKKYKKNILIRVNIA
ncbi:MAG: hypothetical protein IJN88_01165 [Clostridia bacterium]|nr:hypothetical protein [Clostridia bacterium]